MSDSGNVDELARQIADQGRDALVERLRGAYADAAAAHADIVSIDPDRIEAMVQRAADRADGLQWRRALATVAAQRLGISVVDALGHAAVVQAQQLVGAPSYEQSLSELGSRPASPPPATKPPAPAPATPQAIPGQEELFPAQTGLEAVQADDAPVELLPEPLPEETDEEAGEKAEPSTAEHAVTRDIPDPRPGFEPPAGYVPSTEDYSDEEIPSDNLQSVSADDAVFDLLPSVDPGEFDQFGEDELPEVSHTAPPPVLESIPYVPEEEETAARFSDDEVRRADAPTQPYAAFTEAHPTQLHDMAAEFAAQDRAEHAGAAGPEAAAAAAAAAEPTTSEHEAAESPATRQPAVHSESPATQKPAVHSELPARPQFPAAHPASHFSASGGFDEEPEAEPVPEQTGELRVSALHLGGVANLGVREEDLDLRISEAGLDILEPNEEIIGRLQWSDIETLEASSSRGRLLGKARGGAKLVVRTKHGDASFEIPDVPLDELRARVQELSARYRS